MSKKQRNPAPPAKSKRPKPPPAPPPPFTHERIEEILKRAMVEVFRLPREVIDLD